MGRDPPYFAEAKGKYHNTRTGKQRLNRRVGAGICRWMLALCVCVSVCLSVCPSVSASFALRLGVCVNLHACTHASADR